MTKVLLVIVYLLAALGFWQTSERAVDFKNEDIKSVTPPPLVDLPARYMELGTLGHLGVYHTLLNIWSVQYLTLTKTVDGKITGDDAIDSDELFRVLKKIMSHKIRFESFYMLSCFMMALDYKKPENCLEFTNKALEVFPETWRIPMMQGFMSYFKLERPAEASVFYGLAASRKTSPPYVARLARKLAKQSSLSPRDMLNLYEDLSSSMGESGMGEFFKKLMDDNYMAKKEKPESEAKDKTSDQQKDNSETQPGQKQQGEAP